jgi:hypothetical protein
MARPSNQHRRERRQEAMNRFYYSVLPWIVICACIIALMFVLRMIGAQTKKFSRPEGGPDSSTVERIR